MSGYLHRITDRELDELMPDLPAISIEGPKGIGKTETAIRRAATAFRLDDPAAAQLLPAATERLRTTDRPVLLDEWQRHPELWDLVRREVDASAAGGQFLLTGSAAPTGSPIHSGSGRIVTLRMRPLSLSERLQTESTVSLAALLKGGAEVVGDSELHLEDYVSEILASGYLAIGRLPPRARTLQLDGYLARVIEREFAEQGAAVRRPGTLRAWMAAYAAATATTASYEAILNAATPGLSNKPARSTTTVYRDVLSQLWLLDPVPAWTPGSRILSRLATTPKHFLADPALAARLLDLDAEQLMDREGDMHIGPQTSTLLGRLLESLVAISLKTYAQANRASLSHFRASNSWETG